MINLTIDPITRGIKPKIRQTKSVFVARGDKNSVLINFDVPKVIDGHDITEKTIHIHFANLGVNENEVSKGVSDAVERTTDETTLYFGWRIEEASTRYAGVLSVGVTIEGYELNEGEVEENYSFSTAPYGNIVVLDSLDCDREAVDGAYGYLTETCNAIVKEAISGNINDVIKTEFDKMKENGEFKVELTEENKQDIVNKVLEALPRAEGVGF